MELTLHDSDRDIVARLYHLTDQLLTINTTPTTLFRLAKLRLALARLPQLLEEANLCLTFSSNGSAERRHYSLRLGFEDFILDALHTTYDPAIGGDHYSTEYFISNTTGTRHCDDIDEWFRQVDELLVENPHCWDISDDFESDGANIDWHEEVSETLLGILPQPEEETLPSDNAPLIDPADWDLIDRNICPECGAPLPQKKQPCPNCSSTLHLHDTFTLELPADAHICRMTATEEEPEPFQRGFIAMCYRFGDWVAKRPNIVQILIYYFAIPILTCSLFGECIYHIMRYGEYLSGYIGHGFSELHGQVAMRQFDIDHVRGTTLKRMVLGAFYGLLIGMVICLSSAFSDNWPHHRDEQD